MKRLRGLIQLWAFLAKRRWPLLMSFVGFALGAEALFRADLFGLSGLLGVAAFSLGAATLGSDLFTVSKRSRMIHRVDLDPSTVANIRRSDLYRTYSTFSAGLDSYLMSEQVNHLFRTNQLKLRILEPSFKLSGPAREIAPFILRERFKSGAVIFNDKKVRLVTDLAEDVFSGAGEVFVQRTDYFSGLCSNELACSEIRLRNGHHPVLSGFDLCTNHGILDDLESSRCSNHIGVSTLAITRDGALVMPIQARGSAQSPNLATASGSGSVDWWEVREGEMLSGLVAKAATRELGEEIGIGADRGIDIRTIPLGFARVLTRGGKPEFFCASWISATTDQLRVTSKERHFIADILTFRIDRSNAAAMLASLARFESEHSGRFALSLAQNLDVLRDFIRRDPQAALEFVCGDSKSRSAGSVPVA